MKKIVLVVALLAVGYGSLAKLAAEPTTKAANAASSRHQQIEQATK